MSIIGWIIFGLIVGVVAKLFMPGRDPGGGSMTILGIGGALVGGFLGHGLGWYGEGDSVGFFTAVIGAMAMLFAYPRPSRPTPASGDSPRAAGSIPARSLGDRCRSPPAQVSRATYTAVAETPQVPVTAPRCSRTDSVARRPSA